MVTRIAITGATGFIGAAVTNELVGRGLDVTVLLRPGSDTTRLESINAAATLLVADYCDDEIVDRLRVREPECFIHCAWRGVAGDERNEAYQISENVPLALASVELAAAAGCRQWIGLGSQAEYGNPNRRIDESAPTRPTTIYGKAKLAAGVGALALCEAHEMNGVWIRIFSTYGPGDSPRWFLPYVIREMLAGRRPHLTRCEQLWDYLYITDAARAIADVAEYNLAGIFNLGSGAARPLRDYVEAIRSEVDAVDHPFYGAVAYRPDQVMHLEADVSRLMAATDWSPATTLEAGIAATVAFERQRAEVLASLGSEHE